MSEKFKLGCIRPTNNTEESSENQAESSKQNEMSLKGEDQIMIKVGKPAPKFTAAAYHNGEFVNISLDEFKGKWLVLCFYPGDFTFVWATEVSAVAANYNKFKEINTEVLSISVDSIFVHKMWNDNELSKMVNDGVKFPMLSDQSGAIGKLYGVYDEDSGVEMRGRFLIDPDGIVQGYEVLTPSVGRNISETIRQLKAFQYVRESKGTEATPSGWEPGSKTLKPNPNLVGNVWKEWKPSSES